MRLKVVTTTCTPGVTYDKKKHLFTVVIIYNGQAKFVGNFKDINVAVAKSKEAKKYAKAGKSFKKEFQKQLAEKLIKQGLVAVKDHPMYFVSNSGNIYSTKSSKLTLLKQYINSNRYACINLDRKRLKVHRIVAIAFCLGRTKEKNYVNHIDGDKLNNYHTNLEWCTVLENNMHAINILGHKRNVYSGGVVGIVGVAFSKNKERFLARIKNDGKEEYLGTFDCKYEAGAVYQKRYKEIQNEKLMEFIESNIKKELTC